MVYLTLNPRVNCAEVSSKYKDQKFNTLPIYTIGRCNCYTTRLLICFNLNNFNENFEIIEANINFKLKNRLNCNDFINAYKIVTPWNYKTITGNSPLRYDKEKIIFSAECERELYYSFDITQLVREWVDFKEYNNGLILISNECVEGNAIIDAKSICLEVKCIFDKSNCVNDRFYEEFQRIESYENVFFTKAYKTGDFKIVTYFIRNLGDKDIKVRTQVGPDESQFIDENSIFTIKPYEIKAITTYMFSKYSRLMFEAKEQIDNVVEIWFQAHY